MEDRINPVLHLEMSDTDPERHQASRTPEVLALPEVERMTLFRNLHYPRKDFGPNFVFRVQNFGTLAVCEAEQGFEAPELPEGLRGLHVLQYRGPGQGCLDGGPTQELMRVLISAVEESGTQALRDWADFVHLPPLAVGDLGFSMITPYENAMGGEPRYMHFYETPSSDAEAALQAEVHDFPARYGGVETAAYRHWQVHEQLVVDYINTFERVGDA